MDSDSSPLTPAQDIQHKPASHQTDEVKLLNQYRILCADPTPALQDLEWDKLLARYSPTLAMPPLGNTTPTGAILDRSDSPTISKGTLSRTFSESHFVVIDQQGRECEVVQSRCERRRAQNRKAQRAYRARKDAQLKTTSSTLAEKQSQLRTLTHHNRELLETIRRLKAMIAQLKAENQLLKEVQSPDIHGLDEPCGWMLEGRHFPSPLSGETAWCLQGA